MQITKIERAKKRTPAYHIYSDDTLLFTISEETLIHFRLSKGVELSERDLQTIYEYDQVQWCFLQAVRYLSRRGHFELELKQKLHHKGYAPEIIDQTIQQLRQKKLLDDEHLMVQFVHDGIHLRKYGPLLLAKKLMAKGVPSDQIRTYLQEAYPQDKQMQIAAELFRKKQATLPDKLSPQQRRQKLSAFLQQRGFGWDVIRPILNNLSAE